MKIHCPAPAPFARKHRLVLADGHDSIDDSHLTLATLTKFEDQFFRTAQVCAQIEDSRLKITGLQGAGPLYAYRRAGIKNPKDLFDRFQKDTGLKPINTLVAALVLEARQHGITEAVWAGESCFELKPDSILNALHFRKNPIGIYQLPARTPDEQITHRLVGKSAEKQALFDAIRTRYRNLFKEIGF